jgi:hypothetical protein
MGFFISVSMPARRTSHTLISINNGRNGKTLICWKFCNHPMLHNNANNFKEIQIE